MRNEPFLYRSWAEIDTGQIVKNYKIYKEYTDAGQIIAVVKANAYGHGDIEIARALEDAGADFFAVSNIKEAVGLRLGGIRSSILTLGYIPKDRLGLLDEYNIIGTVVSESHAEELMEYAPKNAEFHIAVDTGMHRIGFNADEGENTIKSIKNAAKSLKITGIFTHLSVADSKKTADVNFTGTAVEKFKAIVDGVKDIGIKQIHCHNSAGGLCFMSPPFDTVRLGISLYGYAPSQDIPLPFGIAPALEWKTRIASVFKLKKGESIGYGRSYTAKSDMKVATLMTGYADGYPRVLSNRGRVMINGCFTPIVGKICMDMMMVDVSDIENVKQGDVAVLIGSSGDKKITADNIAKSADTISYEILTGISGRVERVYM